MCYQGFYDTNLDFVSMEMLGVEPRYLFGLSSKDAEAAFQRGEMNMNTDNTRITGVSAAV